MKQYKLTFQAQDYAIKDNIATFKVIASKSGVLTSHGIAFKKDAYKQSIEKLKSDNKREMLPMLFNHNDNDIIGGFPVSSIQEVGDDLLMTAEINLDVASAKEKYALIQQGVMTDLSVGVTVDPQHMVSQKNGTMMIEQVSDLLEVSLVTWGANEKAVITQFSNEQISKFTMRDCEDCLKTLGLSNTSSKIFIKRLKKGIVSDQREVGSRQKLSESISKLEKDLAIKPT